jgi:hypothetical protein
MALYYSSFGLEENSPSALWEIRQDISCVGSEFLKRWIDARRSHQYFVLKNSDGLGQEFSLLIKGIVKLNETDYKMLRTSGISRHRKLAFEGSS